MSKEMKIRVDSNLVTHLDDLCVALCVDQIQDQSNSNVLIPTWSWRIALDIGTLYSEPGVKAIP